MNLRELGFLLRDSAQLFVRRFEQHAVDLDMTLQQCKVLAKLSKHEGISQVRLAELVEVDPMTLVRILDRMEADGWLERRADPSDRRARRLFLKPRSAPLLESIWQLADLTREEAFAGVSKEEREIFMGLLGRFHANLSRAAAADPHPAPAAPEHKSARKHEARAARKPAKGSAGSSNRAA